MAEHFDYDPYTWKNVYRSDYTVGQWDDLIYAELASKRPVLYSGNSNGGGHAFLVDGHDGDGRYHINWGWGGYCDGYFLLHVADAEHDGDGYNFGQDAIIGLQPNTGQVPDTPSDGTEEDDGNIVATVLGHTVSGSSVSCTIGNRNEETYGFAFGVAELSGGQVGELLMRQDYYANTPLGYGWHFTNVTFDLSKTSLPAGRHSLVVVSRESSSTEWKRCKPYDEWMEVTVGSGGTVSDIVYHPVISLEASDFRVASIERDGSSIYANIAFRLTNHGDDCNNSFYAQVKQGENESSRSIGEWSVKAGETIDVQHSILFDAYGTYEVQVETASGTLVGSTTLDIVPHIAASPVTCQSNHIAGLTQQVEATIRNTGADYVGPLYLFVLQGGSILSSYTYRSATAVEAGGTETVVFPFQPTQAGTYTCQIATDDQCAEVIGSLTFAVQAAPTTPAVLTVESETFEEATTTRLTMRVKNTGTVTFYDKIRATLWKPLDDGTGYYSRIALQESDALTLQPGESTEVSYVFTGLTKQQKYWIQVTYNQLLNDSGSSQRLKSTIFTVTTDPSLPGDVNQDGAVNISDVTALVNHILGKSPANFSAEAADVNGSGAIDISDVTALVNLILHR